jgi:hypothetical protein
MLRASSFVGDGVNAQGAAFGIDIRVLVSSARSMPDGWPHIS